MDSARNPLGAGFFCLLCWAGQHFSPPDGQHENVLAWLGMFGVRNQKTVTGTPWDGAIAAGADTM